MEQYKCVAYFNRRKEESCSSVDLFFTVCFPLLEILLLSFDTKTRGQKWSE